MTSAAVIATVLGYIAVLFAVAWVSGRRADNAGFFSGNRRTPWYMAAFAMIGAAMSGVTFISVPGSVAVDGFSYMQMVAGFTVGQGRGFSSSRRCWGRPFASMWSAP